MTADFDIRQPVIDDFDSALDCLVDYRLHTLGSGRRVDPDFPEDAILTVRNRPCIVDFAGHTLVAVQEGKVLGFCCWEWLDAPRGSAKTVLICARPEARALGVGDALQSARLHDMHAAGALEVHTWCDDPRVAQWYCRKFGYERVGEDPIHHTLHLFVCGSRWAWGIHRGHLQSTHLTHLRRALR